MDMVRCSCPLRGSTAHGRAEETLVTKAESKKPGLVGGLCPTADAVAWCYMVKKQALLTAEGFQKRFGLSYLQSMQPSRRTNIP